MLLFDVVVTLPDVVLCGGGRVGVAVPSVSGTLVVVVMGCDDVVVVPRVVVAVGGVPGLSREPQSTSSGKLHLSDYEYKLIIAHLVCITPEISQTIPIVCQVKQVVQLTMRQDRHVIPTLPIILTTGLMRKHSIIRAVEGAIWWRR